MQGTIIDAAEFSVFLQATIKVLRFLFNRPSQAIAQVD